MPVLRAIQGARSVTATARAIWTMPGHLVSASALTTSTADLVANARLSVVCSTFNFQATSGLWRALSDTASRPELSVRVYIDAGASAAPKTGPDAKATATQLFPASRLELLAATAVGERRRLQATAIAPRHSSMRAEALLLGDHPQRVTTATATARGAGSGRSAKCDRRESPSALAARVARTTQCSP